ncbi:anti-repressor SinI family protein [Brevibacillus sp. B_LB10_24]|uniref:anti-repressor SinI family protein n=1 Tax=Brevibacillus sp. B_LB10_24 TaxID=3380645 RepID=UPI0038BE0555
MDRPTYAAHLDPEWIKLILAARNMGLTPAEIRMFLSAGGAAQSATAEREEEGESGSR